VFACIHQDEEDDEDFDGEGADEDEDEDAEEEEEGELMITVYCVTLLKKRAYIGDAFSVCRFKITKSLNWL